MNRNRNRSHWNTSEVDCRSEILSVPQGNGRKWKYWAFDCHSKRWVSTEYNFPITQENVLADEWFLDVHNQNVQGRLGMRNRKKRKVLLLRCTIHTNSKKMVLGRGDEALDEDENEVRSEWHELVWSEMKMFYTVQKFTSRIENQGSWIMNNAPLLIPA
jgi:hypothetical protein